MVESFGGFPGSFLTNIAVNKFTPALTYSLAFSRTKFSIPKFLLTWLDVEAAFAYFAFNNWHVVIILSVMPACQITVLWRIVNIGLPQPYTFLMNGGTLQVPFKSHDGLDEYIRLPGACICKMVAANCPGRELNPHPLARLGPQPSVYANSTTWAYFFYFFSKFDESCKFTGWAGSNPVHFNGSRHHLGVLYRLVT